MGQSRWITKSNYKTLESPTRCIAVANATETGSVPSLPRLGSRSDAIGTVARMHLLQRLSSPFYMRLTRALWSRKGRGRSEEDAVSVFTHEYLECQEICKCIRKSGVREIWEHDCECRGLKRNK